MGRRIVALMSGTSHDAVDVAAAEFHADGDTLWLEPLGALDVPYDPLLRARVAAALPPAAAGVGEVCRLDAELGRMFGVAAARGLAELCGGTADLVVSHGQTVYHWVEDGRAYGTLQLGGPAFVAVATGLPVLADLRSADIAHGGQGAPLLPVFDALLLPPGSAALNLGGIANVTIVGDPVVGYDIGPANALIDAAVRHFHGGPYDAGGRYAAAGRVDGALLAALLAEPYYAAPPPKSTGKELFHLGYLLGHLRGGERPDDVVATVTELTARVVADALNSHRVTEVRASGGGVHNPALMARLGQLSQAPLGMTDDLGVPSDAKEAYAFALIGWLSLHGLPGALPSVTGAGRPAVLGTLTPGAVPLRLPEPAPAMPTRLRIGRP